VTDARDVEKIIYLFTTYYNTNHTARSDHSLNW